MTPGLHVLKLKPVTGCLRTLPVLLPQLNINWRSSQTRRKFCTRSSLVFLPRRCCPHTGGQQADAWMIVEDLLDDTIFMATRFVDYEFRVGAAKQIYPSVLSQFSD
ncbi:hypothetical protein QUA42_25205 [Microcoleus sp. Pol11C2]|uniref:hypothetical protein n=1 Tax=Microcoleus sp. Pol11C2 TaxID=3055389 RepID=UPI002FD0B112